MILTLILIGTLLTGSLLFLIYQNHCQKDFIKHQEHVTLYKEKFQLHKKQIQKRSTYLHQYDLLRYNLSEVLLVQDQIKL